MKRFLFVFLFAVTILPCELRGDDSIIISGRFHDTPERLGFFELTLGFPKLGIPPREIVFVLAPGEGDDASELLKGVLVPFVEKLNSYDSFNVVYYADAFPAKSAFAESLKTDVLSRNVRIVRSLFARTVERWNVHEGSGERLLDPLSNARPVRNPRELSRLIESAIGSIADSRKQICEVVVITSLARGGKAETALQGLFPPGLSQGESVDLRGISDEIARLDRTPRISFVDLGVEGHIERQLRQLALATDGFFVEGDDQIGKAALKFRGDFLRGVEVEVKSTGVNYIHDDRWMVDHDPGALTIVGRCDNAKTLDVVVKGYDGKETRITVRMKTETESRGVAHDWALLRAAHASRMTAAFGEDRFSTMELKYLENGFEKAFPASPEKGDVSGTASAEADAVGETPAEKKKADEEEVELPPHSPLAEMMPGDKAYVLFSSISGMFRFIDAASSIETPFSGIVGPELSTGRIEEYIKLQLALDIKRGNESLYDYAVSEAAMAVGDLTNVRNPEITMLLSLKHSLLFKIRLSEYRNRFKEWFPEAEGSRLEYRGSEVQVLKTPDGRVSSYSAFVKAEKGFPFDEVAVISNSLDGLKSAIDTIRGDHASISQAEGFAAAREVVQYSNDGTDRVFVYISRDVVEKALGASSINTATTRAVHVGDLGMLNDAAGIFSREYPRAELRGVGSLVSAGVIDAGDITGDVSDYYYDENAGGFCSRLFGPAEFPEHVASVAAAETTDEDSLASTLKGYLRDILPLAIQATLRESGIDVDAYHEGGLKVLPLSLAGAVLSGKTAPSIASSLEWDGILIGMKTDVLAGRGIGFSKEQVLIKAAVMQLKREVAGMIGWKSRDDVFAWAGREFIVGLSSTGGNPGDALHGVPGFVLAEVRDSKKAEGFLEAVVAHALGSGKKAEQITMPVGDGDQDVTVIGGVFYVVLTADWMVVANDKGVVEHVLANLKATKEPDGFPTNFVLRIGPGEETALSDALQQYAIEGGRRRAFGEGFMHGTKADRFVRNGIPPAFDPDAAVLDTLFFDFTTGMIASSFYGPAGKSALPGDLMATGPMKLPRFTVEGSVLSSGIRIKSTIRTSRASARGRGVLNIPGYLSGISQRLAGPNRPEFLLDVMSGGLPWLASIASKEMPESGRGGVNALVDTFLKGNDDERIRALRALRGMKTDVSERRLRRLFNAAPEQSPEVERELIETLCAFQYAPAVDEVCARLAESPERWLYDLAGREKISGAAGEIVADVMTAVEDEGEFLRWAYAEENGTESNLHVMLNALSAIGKTATPEILLAAPECTPRQKAFLALAVLGMEGLEKTDLELMKNGESLPESSEFLDELIGLY